MLVMRVRVAVPGHFFDYVRRRSGRPGAESWVLLVTVRRTCSENGIRNVTTAVLSTKKDKEKKG
jgi:hypothetical protein